MHDLDRTFDISETEAEDFEFSGHDDAEGPFDEAEEMELAAELLDVSDDAELEQFLGKLFKRVRRGVRKAGRALRPLGRILRPVAKRLLPIAGRAVGTAFGGPVGGVVGSQVGSLAGRVFRLELEGLSPDDQELEVARRFVRLAGTAAQEALAAPESAPPERVAKMAMSRAARKHAPGLLRAPGGTATSASAASATATSASAASASAAGARSARGGRWIRRGGEIVLLGA